MGEVSWLDKAREVLDKPEGPPDDETICAAMLLASDTVGARLYKLTEAIGLSRGKLRPFFKRFREQGLFMSNGRLSPGDWWDNDHGGIAFVMDVAVGLGVLERK